MIIDCISDLHGYYPDLPGGDLLIVAGDLLAHETKHYMLQFLDWIEAAPYTHKVVTAGNHDNSVQEGVWNLSLCDKFTYLEDSGTEVVINSNRMKIWGSPWTNWFKGVHPSCKAFMDSEDKIGKKFALIPKDTNILVTHSPPYGILDKIRDKHVGSVYLKSQVTHIVKPLLHVFGHIHEHGGQTVVINDTTFVNASHVNERYEPVNELVRVYL
jgi:Icc-related predicted phosphoesterase